MSSHSEENYLNLFQDVDEKALAGADFTAEIIGEIRRAFVQIKDASGVTQKELADRLGISKSAVHRWLYGDGNMTLRKLGELIWAMDCRSAFRLTADLHQHSGEAVIEQRLDPPTATTFGIVPSVCDPSDRWWAGVTDMNRELMPCLPPNSQNQAIGNFSRHIVARHSAFSQGEGVISKKWRANGPIEGISVFAGGENCSAIEVLA